VTACTAVTFPREHHSPLDVRLQRAADVLVHDLTEDEDRPFLAAVLDA